jgi:phosphatidate cytidylyltransferase
MLAQRVITAAVLLALLVPAIFLAPSWVWGGVSLALLAAAAFEWGRLVATRKAAIGLTCALVAAGAAYLLAREPTAPGTGPTAVATVLAGASVLFWLTVVPLSLAQVRRLGPPLAGAALSLLAAWVALYELRLVGSGLLVSAMAIVWLADIGAYFAGRALGRHKLAPKVSPGKTWEGVAGGLLLVLGVAALATVLAPGAAWLPQWLLAQLPAVVAGVLLAALVGLSVVGDLYESMLKRAAGVKDSGRLLPGHGGVLDRIDALVPTMPGCLLLVQVLR